MLCPKTSHTVQHFQIFIDFFTALQGSMLLRKYEKKHIVAFTYFPSNMLSDLLCKGVFIFYKLNINILDNIRISTLRNITNTHRCVIS